jgi:hypothetical protein
MAYSDPPRFNWGCLAAAAFLILVGVPLWIGWGLGECLPGDGSCANKPLEMLLLSGGIVATSVLIVIVTNRLLRKR